MEGFRKMRFGHVSDKSNKPEKPFYQYQPGNILTINEMENLLNEHIEKYGTNRDEDYNSMESSKISEVTIIYSKEQPRINQKTGKNLKYFPELYLFFHNESI